MEYVGVESCTVYIGIWKLSLISRYEVINKSNSKKKIEENFTNHFAKLRFISRSIF